MQETQTSQPAPIYIFDLDGTLADNTHREYLITKGNREWEKFHSLCGDDALIEDVATILQTLHGAGACIYIWTGRPAGVRQETLSWLEDHAIEFDAIRFKAVDDFRHSAKVKTEWVDELSDTEQLRIAGFFENSTKVVLALRRLGLRVYQVDESHY